MQYDKYNHMNKYIVYKFIKKEQVKICFTNMEDHIKLYGGFLLSFQTKILEIYCIILLRVCTKPIVKYSFLNGLNR